jgi:hypothetical protein
VPNGSVYELYGATEVHGLLFGVARAGAAAGGEDGGVATLGGVGDVSFEVRDERVAAEIAHELRLVFGSDHGPNSCPFSASSRTRCCPICPFRSRHHNPQTRPLLEISSHERRTAAVGRGVLPVALVAGTTVHDLPVRRIRRSPLFRRGSLRYNPGVR